MELVNKWRIVVGTIGKVEVDFLETRKKRTRIEFSSMRAFLLAIPRMLTTGKALLVALILLFSISMSTKVFFHSSFDFLLFSSFPKHTNEKKCWNSHEKREKLQEETNWKRKVLAQTGWRLTKDRKNEKILFWKFRTKKL